jgi:hypothetical protein
MPKSDRTRVRHMLDAAREAMRSASEHTRSESTSIKYGTR